MLYELGAKRNHEISPIEDSGDRPAMSQQEKDQKDLGGDERPRRSGEPSPVPDGQLSHAARKWLDSETSAHLLNDLARTFREATGSHREVGVTLARIEAVEAGRDALRSQVELARGFLELWRDIGIQDADDWLYVAYNTAQQVLANTATAINTATVTPIGAWHPIETAPRDGTAFRAYGPSLVHADFNPRGSVEACFDGERFIGAEWDGQHDVWNTVFLDNRATHWMSLPDPPVVGSREDQEKDSRAALLRVDPSASVNTEPLPNWSAIDATKGDFYERRLREEWEAVGGATRGTWFYHPLLPGFGGDSRSGWRYLVFALRQALPLEAIQCAAKLCQSEARKFESADPRTSAHWQKIATQLQALDLCIHAWRDQVGSATEATKEHAVSPRRSAAQKS